MNRTIKTLADRRRKLQLSQNLLAHLAGVGQATVSLVERGLIVPSDDIAHKILAALERAGKSHKT